MAKGRALNDPVVAHRFVLHGGVLVAFVDIAALPRAVTAAALTGAAEDLAALVGVRIGGDPAGLVRVRGMADR